MGFRSALTGFVERPNLKGLLDRRARIMLPEQGEFAYMATLQALAQAGIEPSIFTARKSAFYMAMTAPQNRRLKPSISCVQKKDTMLVGSGAVFQTMNSTVTMNLATIFKLRGINFTISAACASGSHAIGLGYHFIKTGFRNRHYAAVHRK